MSDRFSPFFSERVAERIKFLRGRGARTVQSVQDPPAVVHWFRRDPITQDWTSLGTVQLIKVKFNQNPTSAPQFGSTDRNGYIAETYQGEIQAWAIREDGTETDIRKDDMFFWDGYRVTVSQPFPARNHRVRAAVTFTGDKIDGR